MGRFETYIERSQRFAFGSNRAKRAEIDLYIGIVLESVEKNVKAEKEISAPFSPAITPKAMPKFNKNTFRSLIITA